MVLWLLWNLTRSVLILVPLGLVLLAMVLAAIGKSLGLRRFYIKVLTKIFEFGRQRERQMLNETSNETESSEEDEEDKELPAPFKLKRLQRNPTEYSLKLIERAAKLHTSKIPNVRTLEAMDQFELRDGFYFCQSGIEAIVQDEVTQRFSSTELSSWNLLTRTNNNYQQASWRLTALWIIGGVFRYVVLVPVRIFIVSVGLGMLVLGTAIVGYIKDKDLRFRANEACMMISCRVITRAFGAVINFHNQENRAKKGGICVANHTSPIDVVILQNDAAYAMIGQSHTGFLGIMQKALSRATDHIWFERSVSRDRSAVANRLRKHVESGDKLPVLIFPEGTCINNTSVMMFKKGSFEVGGTIYPVAIKYNPLFADCFWNSSKYSMLSHIALLLSSWAIVCDVWYLPPETRRDGESAVDFANRVKHDIAQQGGLVDLDWDGGLKRAKPKESLKQLQQDIYSKQIKTE